MINAEVVLDSITLEDTDRVVTIAISLPTMMDAEFEKHGNLASNSSSSRAIGFPITKLQDKPYLPEEVYAPETTMHGKQLVSEEVLTEFHADLMKAYDNYIEVLSTYKDKVHKQHLNRYLTPYAMQSKVVTGNVEAWDNFLDLRTSEFADPNIRQLALKVEEVIEASTPVKRASHIPFTTEKEQSYLSVEDCCNISAGRLARVSFNNLGDLERTDTALLRAKRLIELEHKSCFEHQLLRLQGHPEGVTHTSHVTKKPCSGRISGWVQVRKVIWSNE